MRSSAIGMEAASSGFGVRRRSVAERSERENQRYSGQPDPSGCNAVGEGIAIKKLPVLSWKLSIIL